jgi:hypothetical protein
MSQTGQIQAPLKGDPPRASWAQSITEAVNSMLPFSAPGRLLQSGFGGTGTIPAPGNKRIQPPKSSPLPFAVKWARNINNGDGGWIIWLPAGDLLTLGDATVDVVGSLTAAEGHPEGWYILDQIDEAGGEISLIVSKDDDEVSAKFALAASDDGQDPTDDGQTVLGRSVIAVAERNAETGVATVRQCVTSAIVLPVTRTDGDSVDGSGGDDANALQLAHFADTERDSGKGLANRLSFNDESGKLVSDDKELMLVARKNGKIIYIPLDGDGEDPDTSAEDGAENDPCAHPGDDAPGGGVDPKKESSTSGSNSGMGLDGGGGIGGVSASDDSGIHPGDDNCNCD